MAVGPLLYLDDVAGGFGELLIGRDHRSLNSLGWGGIFRPEPHGILGLLGKDDMVAPPQASHGKQALGIGLGRGDFTAVMEYCHGDAWLHPALRVANHSVEFAFGAESHVKRPGCFRLGTRLRTPCGLGGKARLGHAKTAGHHAGDQFREPVR